MELWFKSRNMNRSPNSFTPVNFWNWKIEIIQSIWEVLKLGRLKFSFTKNYLQWSLKAWHETVAALGKIDLGLFVMLKPCFCYRIYHSKIINYEKEHGKCWPYYSIVSSRCHHNFVFYQHYYRHNWNRSFGSRSNFCSYQSCWFLSYLCYDWSEHLSEKIR